MVGGQFQRRPASGRCPGARHRQALVVHEEGRVRVVGQRQAEGAVVNLLLVRPERIPHLVELAERGGVALDLQVLAAAAGPQPRADLGRERAGPGRAAGDGGTAGGCVGGGALAAQAACGHVVSRGGCLRPRGGSCRSRVPASARRRANSASMSARRATRAASSVIVDTSAPSRSTAAMAAPGSMLRSARRRSSSSTGYPVTKFGAINPVPETFCMAFRYRPNV